MGARLAYTTHEAAQLLGVSLPTIVNWIKAGRIDAHRTPGGHRRIVVDELPRFAQANGFPLVDGLALVATLAEAAPPVAVARPLVLVVHAERDFSEMVGEVLEGRLGCQSAFADCAFSAGLRVGIDKPAVVVVDFGTPDLDALRLARVLRASGPPRPIGLIGLVDVVDPILADRARDLGFAALLRQPVGLDRLAEVVAGLI
jgi:excisionase family DNA binding protein